MRGARWRHAACASSVHKDGGEKARRHVVRPGITSGSSPSTHVVAYPFVWPRRCVICVADSLNYYNLYVIYFWWREQYVIDDDHAKPG